MKKYDDQLASGGEVAVLSTQRYGTLYGRVKAWFAQRNRSALLDQAEKQAQDDSAALSKQMQALRTPAPAASPTAPPSAGSPTQTPPTAAAQTIEEKKARLARLQQHAAQENLLDLFEDRIDTDNQLAQIYARWSKQVALQHRIVLHLLLDSFALIGLVVLGTILAGTAVRMLLARAGMEPRREHTLRTILDLGVQLVGVLLIALVIFGAPSQVPTILGLATAGLTVVFQDFILAFFGWFVLMGRNGIRVGDWVEINGVGGEVVEIGLFRTALLETGNWTDKGHPTGRRVTFINNFAITGQYFNFSTAGQWMWDEITLNVPPSENSYQVIEQIHKIVLAETENDAKLAEAEWRGAAKTSGLSQFSATPSVDLRPAASGVDIQVRYVTRAVDRFSMRNKLYQDTIEVLQKEAAATAAH
jgi:small-conductance mechanosensitive channel